MLETEFPYHPHVTIAHHLPEGLLEQAFVELERFDAEFDVTQMWLYLHDPLVGLAPGAVVPARALLTSRRKPPETPIGRSPREETG